MFSMDFGMVPRWGGGGNAPTRTGQRGWGGSWVALSAPRSHLAPAWGEAGGLRLTTLKRKGPVPGWQESEQAPKVLRHSAEEDCMVDEIGGEVEYRLNGKVWTIVVHGMVAIAMDEPTAERWREGGAQLWLGPHSKNKPARAMAIGITREGWRRGYHLVVGYAPTTRRGCSREVRDEHREQI